MKHSYLLLLFSILMFQGNLLATNPTSNTADHSKVITVDETIVAESSTLKAKTLSFKDKLRAFGSRILHKIVPEKYLDLIQQRTGKSRAEKLAMWGFILGLGSVILVFGTALVFIGSVASGGGSAVGLVLAGLLSILGYIAAPLSVVLSAVALSKINKAGGEKRGLGFAIAGLTLGGLMCILLLISLFAAI